MTEAQEKLKKHFHEPEMRCGYYVSAEKKAVWKVLLDIFEEFQKICEKHKLKYFAGFGTLLGAVRHQGFIPWDDDLDVLMPRADYDVFLEVAQDELPSNLFLQTQATDSEAHIGSAKIRNSATTAIEKGCNRFSYLFNRGMFIDIQPCDGFIDDWNQREKQRVIQYFLDLIRFKGRAHINKGCSRKILSLFCKIVLAIIGDKRLFGLREMNLRRIGMDKSKFCAMLAYTPLAERSKMPVEFFDNLMEWPFEYLTIKVPCEYEHVLDALYRDWRTPKQGESLHEFEVLNPSRPFRDVLQEQYGFSPRMIQRIP